MISLNDLIEAEADLIKAAAKEKLVSELEARDMNYGDLNFRDISIEDAILYLTQKGHGQERTKKVLQSYFPKGIMSELRFETPIQRQIENTVTNGRGYLEMDQIRNESLFIKAQMEKWKTYCLDGEENCSYHRASDIMMSYPFPVNDTPQARNRLKLGIGQIK